MKYVVDIVKSLHERKMEANKKKQPGNPFEPKDFYLSQEEFDMLPHMWFKYIYATFKRATVPNSMTADEEQIAVFEAKQASGVMPHKSLFGHGWVQGGSRKRVRKSKSKSYRSRKARYNK